MGCFATESGPEFSAFEEVAADLEGFGGVALGKTTTKAVWSRYLSAEDGAEAPPAVVLWTSFDPESGKVRVATERSTRHFYGVCCMLRGGDLQVRKGKKTKLVFSGPWEYGALYKFLVRESQPLVLRLPEREGPDFQKRQQMGMHSGKASPSIQNQVGGRAAQRSDTRVSQGSQNCLCSTLRTRTPARRSCRWRCSSSRRFWPTTTW